MTSPIVLRSEILSLLQTGGLGNAGTSGSAELASLNSQLISLTQRVARLEGSSTYQETEGPTTNWNYIKEAGVCYAAGSVIITQDYTTTQKIKLATISEECIPLNTDFVGVACLYDSAASTGTAPLELRMGFEETTLYAYPESYISASSSATKFLKFQTMWFPQKELVDNPDNTAAIYTRRSQPTLPSRNYVIDESKYYTQIHSVGGVYFVCGYQRLDSSLSGSKSISAIEGCPDSNWYIKDSNKPYFGCAFVREGETNTVHQGQLYNDGSSYMALTGFPAISSTTNYIYFYGVAFSRSLDITFGDYEEITDFGAGYSATQTVNYVRYLRFGEVHYLEFFIFASGTHGGESSSWTEETLFTSSKMPAGVSDSNFTLFTTGSERSLYPINIRNKKCIMSLKPVPSMSNYIHGCCIMFHDSAN